ncbi:MAG: hypothetical protein ACU836_14180 [Gammaproteobacteria bacterium]
MPSVEQNNIAKHEVSQLHAATCVMMTRFISGQHCPKLANVIVQQLRQLVEHPATQRLPESRDMYSQLLKHWLEVSSSLTDKTQFQQPSYLYH